MQLYQVTVWAGTAKPPFDFSNRFVSSMAEVKELIRKKKRFKIYEVTLKDRLTKEDLIKLLEGDASGNQELKMTPMDPVERKNSERGWFRKRIHYANERLRHHRRCRHTFLPGWWT
jgi:hypothetical protein